MKYLILLVVSCLLSANSFALDRIAEPKSGVTEVCVGGYVYVVFSGFNNGGIVQKFVADRLASWPLKPVKCKR